MTDRDNYMTNSEGNADMVRVESPERRLEGEAITAIKGIFRMRPEIQDHVVPKFEKKTFEAPNGNKVELLVDPRSEILKEFNHSDTIGELSSSVGKVFGGDAPHVIEVAREDVDEYFDAFLEGYRVDVEHEEIVRHIENEIKPKTIEFLSKLGETYPGQEAKLSKLAAVGSSG